jgi:hypothetical protein
MARSTPREFIRLWILDVSLSSAKVSSYRFQPYASTSLIWPCPSKLCIQRQTCFKMANGFPTPMRHLSLPLSRTNWRYSELAPILTRSREIETKLSHVRESVTSLESDPVPNAGRFKTTAHIPLTVVSDFLDVATHLSGQQTYTCSRGSVSDNSSRIPPEMIGPCSS